MNFRFKKKKAPNISALPTLLTLGNGICGFGSVIEASKGNFELSAWLIFLGMFFDAFDGMAARLTKSSSNFGAQLDSLSDVISFGLAPAFLVYSISTTLAPSALAGFAMTKAFWVISAFYVVCTILRLAKFNVTTDLDPESHQYFSGLPSPGAAGMIASTVILLSGNGPNSFLTLANFSQSILFLTLFVGLLMISRVKYAHFSNRILRTHYKFHNLMEMLLIALLVALKPELCLCFGLAFYVMSGPVMHFAHSVSGRDAKDSSQDTDDPAPDHARKN